MKKGAVVERLFAVALALAGFACTPLLGLDKDFQEDADAAPPDETDASSDSGGTTTDGAEPDEAAVPDTGAGADATARPDATAPRDAGADARPRDAAVDARADADAGAAGLLPCGAALTCKAGEKCCYVAGGTSTCNAGACAAGLPIPCHVADDCAGAAKACCVAYTGTTASQVSCQDFASCPVNATSTILCAPADGAAACPAGKTCLPTVLTNVPSTYYQCK
jgi:hypothetical protein